jgi:hypothetical protein
MIHQTLTLILLAFVLHDIVKIWVEHKTWNQNFQQSQSKNDKNVKRNYRRLRQKRVNNTHSR